MSNKKKTLHAGPLVCGENGRESDGKRLEKETELDPHLDVVVVVVVGIYI